jgi:hypothetical protein
MNQNNEDEEIIMKIFLVIILVTALVIMIVNANKHDPKSSHNHYISFPEEPITIGDSLVMYEQGDTIFVGFYHPPLRGGEELIIVK